MAYLKETEDHTQNFPSPDVDVIISHYLASNSEIIMEAVTSRRYIEYVVQDILEIGASRLQEKLEIKFDIDFPSYLLAILSKPVSKSLSKPAQVTLNAEFRANPSIRLSIKEQPEKTQSGGNIGLSLKLNSHLRPESVSLSADFFTGTNSPLTYVYAAQILSFIYPRARESLSSAKRTAA